jgi:hypothetical protein
LGEVVERGQIGEVFVSGAHVAEGYINGTKTGNTTSFIANAAEKRKGMLTKLNIQGLLML